MSESIISTKRECYICGSQYQLERHHCWKAFNRDHSEEDGLWVYLCPSCHRGKYGVHGYAGHEYDMALRRTAEFAWLEKRGYLEDGRPTDEGIRKWIDRYGRNLL